MCKFTFLANWSQSRQSVLITAPAHASRRCWKRALKKMTFPRRLLRNSPFSLSLSSSQQRSTDVREVIFFKRVKRHHAAALSSLFALCPECIAFGLWRFASSSTNEMHLFAKHREILDINLGQIYAMPSQIDYPITATIVRKLLYGLHWHNHNWK